MEHLPFLFRVRPWVPRGLCYTANRYVEKPACRIVTFLVLEVFMRFEIGRMA